MMPSGNTLKETAVIPAATGYDRIAFIYDIIAGIASFDQINKSQLAFLSSISTQSTCLILGGGTGYFLQKLLEQNTTIQVTYVDASQKMIEFAQKRIAEKKPYDAHRVTFVCKQVNVFEFDTYDSIVCNYFLDLFEEADVTMLIKKFKKHLKKDGILYITDFTMPIRTGIIQWSAKAGLKVLYWFFKRTTSLSNNQLPDIESVVLKQDFIKLHSADFFKGILRCSLYR